VDNEEHLERNGRHKGSTNATVKRRVDVVYEYLLRGLGTNAIVDAVKDEHPDWGVRRRSVCQYIARARQAMLDDSETIRKEELGRAIGRLHMLYRLAFDAKDYRPALAIVKELAELLGLHAPTTANVNLHISPEQARAELETRRAKEIVGAAEEITARAAGIS